MRKQVPFGVLIGIPKVYIVGAAADRDRCTVTIMVASIIPLAPRLCLFCLFMAIIITIYTARLQGVLLGSLTFLPNEVQPSDSQVSINFIL